MLIVAFCHQKEQNADTFTWVAALSLSSATSDTLDIEFLQCPFSYNEDYAGRLFFESNEIQSLQGTSGIEVSSSNQSSRLQVT
jgi:hypothetical protein